MKNFSLPRQLICQHRCAPSLALSSIFLTLDEVEKHFQYCKKFFIAHSILFIEKRLLWKSTMASYRTHMLGTISLFILTCWWLQMELNWIRMYLAENVGEFILWLEKFCESFEGALKTFKVCKDNGKKLNASVQKP